MVKKIFILALLFLRFIEAQVTWSPAVTISDPLNGGEDPQVAVSPAGYAVAIWDDNNDIASASRPFMGNWTFPIVTGGGSGGSPRLGIDNTGNVVAVWAQAGTIGGGILPYNSTWTLAPVFTTPIVAVNSPAIAVNPSGEAVAVWMGNTGTQMIQGARLTPFGNTTWAMTADLSTPGQSGDNPQVAFGASDKVVAVWLNQSTSFIESAHMTYNTGVWSAPTALSASASSAPQVAIDPSGNAIAVWVATDGANNRIYAARLAYGTGTWAVYPTPLSTAGENASEPQVAIDSSGNAIAVWTESSAGQFYIRAASLPAPGTTFTLFPFLSGTGAGAPQIAIDPSGNAIAIWIIPGTPPFEMVQSSDLSAGASSWTTPVNVSPEEDIYNAFIAIDGFGDPVVVWTYLPQGGINYEIRSSSGYVPSSGFNASIQTCNFGAFKDKAVFLSWPSVADTLAYRLYRNNEMIATLAPAIQKYIDKIIKKGKTQNYVLTRINSQGSEVLVGTSSVE